jgi:nucleotidyltransferase substrate binding protein (TIGR01987 family)
MKPELWLMDYERALRQLTEALLIEANHDVVRAGCIQYFEFTFELAWKSIKVVSELEGLEPGGSPKSNLRSAFAQGWIDDEAIWLEMLDARNRMSHTYDAQDALSIYDRLASFIGPFEELLARLKRLN